VPRRIFRACAGFVLTIFAGGCLTATMVRLSPGFSADEELLDARLNQESQAALRATHNAERSIAAFYFRSLTNILRGDFGYSRSMQRPVRELLAARLPVTIRLIGIGLAGAWLLGV